MWLAQTFLTFQEDIFHLNHELGTQDPRESRTLVRAQNILFIFVTLLVSHFEISGKLIKDEQL